MSWRTFEIAMLDEKLSGNQRLALMAIGDNNGVFSSFESATRQVMRWANVNEERAKIVLVKLLNKGVLRYGPDSAIVHPEMNRVFVEYMTGGGGYQKSWSASKTRRNKIYARDGNACVYCGATLALTIDHVIPQSKGGTHDDDNLATCCKSCNSSKGTKTGEEFEAWRAERGANT